MKQEIDTELSELKANLHIAIIGVFHIISGFWELGVGITQLEGTPSGIYFLLDVYRDYVAGLGLVTILIGIVFFPGLIFFV